MVDFFSEFLSVCVYIYAYVPGISLILHKVGTRGPKSRTCTEDLMTEAQYIPACLIYLLF